ncbi:MAG: DUF2232 domain-containing protein [Anaerovoracaceae bacterium]
MYIGILFAAMVVMPMNFIRRGIAFKVPPFQVISRSILWTGFGLLFILGISAAMGENVIDEIQQAYQVAAKTLAENGELAKQLGIDSLPLDERVKFISSIYDVVAQSLIAMLFTFSAIISFFEYKIFAKLKYGEVPPSQKPLIREFNLKPENLTGWFIIYLVVWLIKASGAYVGEIATLNVNLLIESIFALQGISVICYAIYIKRKPIVLGGILCVALWLLPFGKQLLFILGLLEIVLGLKKRVSN